MWQVVEVVGAIALAVAVAAVLGALVALGAGALAYRGRWAPLAAFSVFLLEFFYVPLKRVFAALGRVPDLDEMMVTLRSRVDRRRFAEARRRILMAPQCMRHPDCPAPSSGQGILCKACGRCKLDRILAEARRLGYRAFILTGSSVVRRLIAEEKPDGALVVACAYECNRFMMELGRLAIYAVCLDRDGCVRTDVALSSVLDALRMGLEDVEDKEECVVRNA